MTATTSQQVFDRAVIREHRRKSAAYSRDSKFLFDWAYNNLTERAEVIQRQFPRACQLGARHDAILNEKLIKTAGIKTLITADHTPTLLSTHKETGPVAVLDEERLPLAKNSLDMVASCLSLHTVNDLPGALIQIRRALKPDGVFLGAVLGGETLYELRTALMEAEMSLRGGVSPRVAPFADKQQMGALMQRAGYALPVVDSEFVRVAYTRLQDLLKDIKQMGESNSLLNRSKALSTPRLFALAEKIYRRRFSESTKEAGPQKLTATFEVIFLIGWAPHKSQQKPLRPGSADKSLADALDTDEVSTGAPTQPPPPEKS